MIKITFHSLSTAIMLFSIGCDIKQSPPRQGENVSVKDTKVATPVAKSPANIADYGLQIDLTAEEAGSMLESTNHDWWVNSGGYFFVKKGIGSSVQGDLPSTDRWFRLYKSSNPTDTDDGKHPQNIFRLMTKKSLGDVRQIAYFKINAYNASASPNREGHNGILFFSRYQDGDTSYYTGLRVDGRAIIKKKVNGKYFTLAQPKIIEGAFNRNTRPNLLPLDTWIGMWSEVKTKSDKTVAITIAISLKENPNLDTWSKTETLDDGDVGGPPIQEAGYAGIRSDFMDLEFKEYQLNN